MEWPTRFTFFSKKKNEKKKKRKCFLILKIFILQAKKNVVAIRLNGETGAEIDGSQVYFNIANIFRTDISPDLKRIYAIVFDKDVELTSSRPERTAPAPGSFSAERAIAAQAYRKLNKKSELTPQELAAMMSSGSIGFDLSETVRFLVMYMGFKKFCFVKRVRLLRCCLKLPLKRVNWHPSMSNRVHSRAFL